MIYQGFPISFLPLILCPRDSGGLETTGSSNFIVDGEVRCALCGASYLITNGIIRFDNLINNDQMKQEVTARDNHASDYDRRLSPRFYREIEPTLELLGPTENKKILEYGAGTGRLTAEIAKAKIIIAVDFSLASLKILASKELKSPVVLICGDATQVKCKGGYFDLVVATQLIEHLPSRELRQQFYSLVKKHLAPDGLFLATVYHQDLRRRYQDLNQEGKHKGGIFYHYFLAKEWRRELELVFGRVKIGYLDFVWPLLSRVRLKPKIEGRLSRFGASLPIIQELSHLLWVKAK